MSKKQAKKRKPSLFDPDKIKATLAEQTNYLREVREKICALNDVVFDGVTSQRQTQSNIITTHPNYSVIDLIIQ